MDNGDRKISTPLDDNMETTKSKVDHFYREFWLLWVGFERLDDKIVCDVVFIRFSYLKSVATWRLCFLVTDCDRVITHPEVPNLEN